MKKLILLLIILITLFSVNAASSDQAITDIGVYEQGKAIILTYNCGTCVTANVTSVISPNSTELITNQEMTKSVSKFTYSLITNYTQGLGEYRVYGFAMDVADDNHTWSYTFTVTPSGTLPTTSQSIMYVFLLVILLTLFGISSYFTITIDSKNTWDVGGNLLKINMGKYLKIALFFASYLIFIFISFISWQITNQFFYLSFASGIWQNIHETLWIFLTPIVIALVAILFVHHVVNDSKLLDLAKRKLKPYGGEKK